MRLGVDARMLAARARAGKRKPCAGLLEAAMVAALEHDEDDAVQDEHRGNADLVVKMLVHPIVEREAEHRRRNAPDDDHAPQPPGAFALRRRLLETEGVELVEVHDDDGENRADLDDHEEQGEELVGYLQFHELVDEDHVAGRRDGQPFGNAFDNALEQGFQDFDNHV